MSCQKLMTLEKMCDDKTIKACKTTIERNKGEGRREEEEKRTKYKDISNGKGKHG